MHEQFRYNAFRISEDATTVFFDYTIVRAGQRHLLTETLEFPRPLSSGAEQLRSLRALHLALGLTYYKLFVPGTMVHPYAMDTTEADFWNNVWQHGLGEFLYVNQLSAERLARFSAQTGQRFGGTSEAPAAGALLGIGGGKDSIVAGELLRNLGVPVTGFVMATGEQLGQAASVAQVMGVDLRAVKRHIDPQFQVLRQAPGAYHGHIPISLVFGLVGTALAIAEGAAYVVVANEASASIPRVMWQDRAVNHQWSKSFEFEQQLQQFVHEHITKQITYFSAIRQLTSVGVAKVFANLPQYFEVFTSDNHVFRIDPARRPSGRWGLESPKSLSSYMLLAPWLSDADVSRTFTIDFLNEPSLQRLFLELTGVEGEPPLDCVGTVEELILSLNLLAQQGRYTDTLLMKLAKERGVVNDDNWQAKLQSLLSLQVDQALPPTLRAQVAKYFEERTKE
jgi:UDP-N-acetyl-alpha-D-muramoyl-L-alanyl-L-glutamate epimerase